MSRLTLKRYSIVSYAKGNQQINIPFCRILVTKASVATTNKSLYKNVDGAKTKQNKVSPWVATLDLKSAYGLQVSCSRSIHICFKISNKALCDFCSLLD